jgi:hypothetical protein
LKQRRRKNHTLHINREECRSERLILILCAG